MAAKNYWDEACKSLSKKDKVLAKIIKSYQGETLESQGDSFKTLANAIIGQQVSVKAAEAIFSRFLKLMGHSTQVKKQKLNYKKLFKLSDEELREIGLSRQKIQYLRNIAEFFQKHNLTEKHFEIWSSEKIAEELLAIKGIGKWTLEMFQIFYLNDPDVFPIGDIGLIKAIQKYYGSKIKNSSKEEILKFSEQWRPYRTVVTWYLWRTIDSEAVKY